MCAHKKHRKRAGLWDDAKLQRIEIIQRKHRTPETRARKAERWPYQAAFNTIVRQEMCRRRIFDAAESFGLGT